MAKKTNNNQNENRTSSIGFSSKGKKTPTTTAQPERDRLTKNQIIIIICVALIAVTISGAIIGTVIAVKNINNPDFMTSNLSRYISISEDGYKGYEIDIPLDSFSESAVDRKVNMLLTEHKTLNEEYKGRYPKTHALAVGDTVKIYYRGYTVGEDGRETDFEGSSNFTDTTTTIEVGTGNIIDDETGKVSGNFIAGFGESLVGFVPKDYSDFDKLTTGRIMAGDVIYLSYTVIGESGSKSSVKNERIDLALPYIDEIYGTGFTEFFVGKLEDGEAKGFKNIGEDISEFICRIGDDKTDTVYSDMKVEFVTRGCETNPITITVRFPANYGVETLNGKEAKFDVYIDNASLYDVPAFDDKFITETLKVSAEDLSSYSGATLTEKYRAKLREECKTEIEESNHELLLDEMWAHIISNVEIKKLPRTTVETYYNAYYSKIASYYSGYTSQYDTLDKFAVAYLNNTYGAGLATGGDWQGYITKLAEGEVTQKTVFYYIIREENFFPSDEEYREIYDNLYNDILDYYLELHEEEFSKLEGDEYEKELQTLKEEIDGYYGESYFTEQVYFYYGTRKMIELAKVVNQ